MRRARAALQQYQCATVTIAVVVGLWSDLISCVLAAALETDKGLSSVVVLQHSAAAEHTSGPAPSGRVVRSEAAPLGRAASPASPTQVQQVETSDPVATVAAIAAAKRKEKEKLDALSHKIASSNHAPTEPERGLVVSTAASESRTDLNRTVTINNQVVKLQMVCRKDARAMPDPLWKGRGCYNQPCEGTPLMPCWNNSCWIEATGAMNFCAETQNNCEGSCGGLWCNGDETEPTMFLRVLNWGFAGFWRGNAESSKVDAAASKHPRTTYRRLATTATQVHMSYKCMMVHVGCMVLAVSMVLVTVLRFATLKTSLKQPT